MVGTSANSSGFAVTPATTTTYWAEAYSLCGASATRTSVTITVNPGTLANPVAISTPTLVCAGQVSSYSATTPVGIIRWWTAPTGGTLIASTASGASLYITPTTQTVYYADAYSACGTSSRLGDTVFIGTLSPPYPVTATPSSLNCGIGSSNLSGTTLAQNIAWYDAASGGNLIGTSTSTGTLNVYPISTTVYYAESQNIYTGSQTFSYTGATQTSQFLQG